MRPLSQLGASLLANEQVGHVKTRILELLL